VVQDQDDGSAAFVFLGGERLGKPSQPWIYAFKPVCGDFLMAMDIAAGREKVVIGSGVCCCGVSGCIDQSAEYARGECQ
jgi:hypothetical protein